MKHQKHKKIDRTYVHATLNHWIAAWKPSCVRKVH